MIYTVNCKGTTWYSERKLDVIYKHVTFKRKDKARFNTVTPKAFAKIKGRKVEL